MPTRPTSITVICILGFLGALVTIPALLLARRLHLPAWYPPYLGVSAVIGLVCMVGLWRMRKWAALTYAAFAVLNQVVLIATHQWNVLALLIPAVVVFFCFRSLKEMA
jgi:hypothetical protein